MPSADSINADLGPSEGKFVDVGVVAADLEIGVVRPDKSAASLGLSPEVPGAAPPDEEECPSLTPPVGIDTVHGRAAASGPEAVFVLAICACADTFASAATAVVPRAESDLFLGSPDFERTLGRTSNIDMPVKDRLMPGSGAAKAGLSSIVNRAALGAPDTDSTLSAAV